MPPQASGPTGPQPDTALTSELKMVKATDSVTVDLLDLIMKLKLGLMWIIGTHQSH